MNRMPIVVAYPDVLETLTHAGLVCLYHNSGAFGFSEETKTQSAGWILREDPTIRASVREIARVVSPATEKTLAAMAGQLWADHFPQQQAWVMPKSHWAYELDFGSHQWMPAVLAEAEIHADQVVGRNDGSAIEFSLAERAAFELFVERLLSHLAGSDFMIVFSDASTVCTIHHHKQLWWTTRDMAVAVALKKMD